MTTRLPHGMIRVVGVLATLVYGWWLLTYFRTTNFGNDNLLNYILIGMIYVLPISLLVLLGLRTRIALIISVLVVVASITTALSWATIEEYTVMRSVSAGSEYYGERWWPFSQNTITYTPTSGWHGSE